MGTLINVAGIVVGCAFFLALLVGAVYIACVVGDIIIDRIKGSR